MTYKQLLAIKEECISFLACRDGCSHYSEDHHISCSEFFGYLDADPCHWPEDEMRRIATKPTNVEEDQCL